MIFLTGDFSRQHSETRQFARIRQIAGELAILVLDGKGGQGKSTGETKRGGKGSEKGQNTIELRVIPLNLRGYPPFVSGEHGEFSPQIFVADRLLRKS